VESRSAATIGPLEEGDQRAVVAVLARAFRDNPINVAVIGSDDPERRLRANTHGMRTLIPVARDHGETLVARFNGRLAGALIAAPPHAYPLPPPRLLSRLRCLVGQGWRVAQRWRRVFEALDALHPVEPHWYLGTLGVAPELESRGIGTALLDAWLERADRDGSAAYLETDRIENVGFYERAGFAVEAEADVLGARVWCMRRPPREH
jgi:ribosomal protein S18 acetylase RimI-like enzyme